MVAESSTFILLNRDGTLIKHVPYLANSDLAELLPSATESLQYLAGLGYSFGIITIQSAIGRNLAAKEAVDSVNNRVLSLLTQQGVHISFVLLCPYTPEDLCECRTPLPQLGLKAIDQYGINAPSSYKIGDMEITTQD